MCTQGSGQHTAGPLAAQAARARFADDEDVIKAANQERSPRRMMPSEGKSTRSTGCAGARNPVGDEMGGGRIGQASPDRVPDPSHQRPRGNEPVPQRDRQKIVAADVAAEVHDQAAAIG